MATLLQHKKYANDNKEEFQIRFDSAELSIKAMLWPSGNQILRKTAKKLIADLNLKHVPGYAVYPRTVIGGSAYVFHEFLHKY